MLAVAYSSTIMCYTCDVKDYYVSFEPGAMGLFLPHRQFSGVLYSHNNIASLVTCASSKTHNPLGYGHGGLHTST